MYDCSQKRDRTLGSLAAAPPLGTRKRHEFDSRHRYESGNGSKGILTLIDSPGELEPSGSFIKRLLARLKSADPHMTQNPKLLGEISAGQMVVLGTMLCLGIFLAFTVPVGAGFDEEQHIRRAWEMSALALIPNSRLGPDMPVPAVLSQLSYRNENIIRPVGLDYWAKYGSLTLGSEGWIYDDASTRSIYSPVLLAPQALVMRYLGRKYDLPVLWLVSGMRLAELFSYLVLIYLAVRLIPFGKWVLLILAATPTLLFQASTVSADAISNGIGFLFVGGILTIAARKSLRWKEVAWVSALTLLLFTAKVNLTPLVILPFLLIRPRSRNERQHFVVLLAIAVMLFVIEVIGWYLLAYSHPAGGTLQTSSPLAQLGFIAGEPLTYLVGLARDLATNGLAYITGWIAAYGFYYWSVPALTYWLFAFALVMSLLADRADPFLTRRTRLLLVGVAALGYLATAIILQLVGEPAGSTNIHVLQGRYFAAFAPLLFLALTGLFSRPHIRHTGWMIGVPAGLGVALFTIGGFLAYHIPCGSSYYQLGLCYQPMYKNWAPEANYSAPVQGNTEYEETFPAECDGVTQVRLWLDASGAESSAATEFVIRGAGNTTSLYDQVIANSKLPTGGWQVLNFRPQWQSNGTSYSVLVRSAAKDSAPGPKLALTYRPEYQVGHLTIGQKASADDLFFQYGCLQGLARGLSILSP